MFNIIFSIKYYMTLKLILNITLTFIIIYIYFIYNVENLIENLENTTGGQTGQTGQTGRQSGQTGPTGGQSGQTGPTGGQTGQTGQTGRQSGQTGPTGGQSGQTGPTGGQSGQSEPSGGQTPEINTQFTDQQKIDIKNIINDLYMSDVDAIRNLSDVATKLQTPSGLIIPKQLTCTGVDCGTGTITGGLISAGTITSSKINNSNPTDTFNIGDLMTGIINIGENASRNNPINISTLSNLQHNINIGNEYGNNQGLIINSKNIIIGSTGGVTTINRPLNPGYSTNPSSIYSLGGVRENTPIATAVLSGTPVSVAQFSAQLGVYQVFYQIKYTITVAPITFTQQCVCICDTVNAINTVYNQMETLENRLITRPIGDYTITGGGVWINNVTDIISPIYLNVRNTFIAGPTLSANANLRIVRIG